MSQFRHVRSMVDMRVVLFSGDREHSDQTNAGICAAAQIVINYDRFRVHSNILRKKRNRGFLVTYVTFHDKTVIMVGVTFYHVYSR